MPAPDVRGAGGAPEAPTLVDTETELAYEELDWRAERPAACLRDERIHPDEVVGVYMERRDDFAVARLAALKMGGAFLLKPAYPVSVARGGER